MFQIYEYIVENWKLLSSITILLFLLSVSGKITILLRAAKVGLKEAFTPLGFGILLTLSYVFYQIIKTITETL